MSKRNGLGMYLLAVSVAGYACVGMAEDAGVATARWQAYLGAASSQGVNSIPASARITDADELGHRSIALFTADKSDHEIWLVSTGADCEQPRLAGDRIVSTDLRGRTQACSVDAIRPVNKRLLALQMMWQKRGVHSPLATGSAYGPDNTVNAYETNMREMSMTDGGRTR